MSGSSWRSTRRTRHIRHALPAIFEGLANANELGSLLKVEEIVEDEIAAMRRTDPLFAYSMAAEGWGTRLMARLREHFEAEAQAADLVQAFFSRSAGKGLALLDLLARRYDVVTANPPWMGSKNMGPVVKQYVERHYSPGKRDLYAAFILRCLELADKGGRVAMVTQQSWMFLSSFKELRTPKAANNEFRGLLRGTSMEVTAQLGRYAFSELGNGVIQPQLFVFSNHDSIDNFIICFRLTAPRIAQEQAQLLRSGASGGAPHITSKPFQARFLSLPGNPVCYWLTDHFLNLLSGQILKGVVESREGITTTENNRFMRYSWEAQVTDGWPQVPKGGAYSKWEGLEYWVLDWRDGGARLRNIGKATLRNLEFWNKPGWTYTQVARGAMGLRRLPERTALEHKGPAIFGVGNQPVSAAMFNCRLVSYMLRLINQGSEFRSESIERVPAPRHNLAVSGAIEASCCSLKQRLISASPIEWSFNATSGDHTGSLLGDLVRLEDQHQAVSATLHAVEGGIERKVFMAYEVEEEELTTVLDETGTPAGWHSLIAGYEAIPPIPEGLPPVPIDDLVDHPRRNFSPEDLADLKCRLRALYEAGPGATVEEDEEPATESEDDEDEETVVVGGTDSDPHRDVRRGAIGQARGAPNLDLLVAQRRPRDRRLALSARGEAAHGGPGQRGGASTPRPSLARADRSRRTGPRLGRPRRHYSAHAAGQGNGVVRAGAAAARGRGDRHQ